MIAALLLALAVWQQASDVRFHFVGLERLSERELLKLTVDEQADLRRNGFRNAEVDDMAFRMESYAHDHGLPFARVRWQTRREEGVLHATFQVSEGPTTVLGARTVSGNERFTDDELLAYLLPPGDTLLNRQPAYHEGRVRSAPGAIVALYRSHGYLDATVEPTEVQFSANRNQADLHLQIHEGPWYHIIAVDLVPANRTAPEPLQEIFADWIGDSFFPRRAFDLERAVVAFYADRGHPDCRARVEAQRNSANGEVRLALQWEPGPVVTIGRIRIDGTPRTRESFLRNRLALQAGEPWNQEKQRESFRQLFRTGLFRRVDLHLDGAGETRDLVVAVEEGEHKELTIEPGYGSYEKLRLQLGWRDKNFLGSGRALRTELAGSMKSSSALVGWTDPWLFGNEIELDAPLYFRRREEPSFRRQEAGAALQFRWRQSRRLSWLWGYRLVRTEVAAESSALPTNIEAEDATLASVFAGPRYDTRNDWFNPTRGGVHRLQVELGSDAFGSQVDFLRGELQLAHYQPLGSAEDDVLALALRSEAVVPIGSTDQIPLQLRVFNGGENSVRAFQESRLGPLDSLGQPVGGEIATTLNLEWRHRLNGNLWGGLFVDHGNTGLKIGDFDRDFRTGLGAGLRYLLPVGALRLDAAILPDARGSESNWLVHLSVGMAF